MSKKTLVVVVALAVLLVSGIVYAQVGNFDLRYYPQSATTISGKVLSTINYNPGNPATGAQAILVQANNGQIYTVFLGPGWYANQIGATFPMNSTVTVTGSLRNIAGSTYLVASTITTPTNTYAFRSANGMTLWAPQQVVVVPPPVGSGPGGVVSGPMVPFNANKIITTSGKISSIYTMQTPEDSRPIVVAELRPTDVFSRRERILLGPSDILTQSGISLNTGDHLSIRGSRTDINGQRFIVATSVSQGPNFVNLRSTTGIPLWVGSVTSGTALTAPEVTVPSVVPPPPM